ncbi:MAG: hypothetical protein LQ345_005792 [Seirophora villosa]|nr:MAG: hypothetical protein LQ345_005792 [Seirophora villosa]
MANEQSNPPTEWYEAGLEEGSPFTTEKDFMKMPTAKKDRLAEQVARQRRILHRKLRRSSVMARRIIAPTPKARNRCHINNLPGELVLEIMKKTKSQDLRNLVQANKGIRSIAKLNARAIHIGIQKEQFPDLHQLFGTAGQKTPDQEYHSMIEEENRKWWRVEEEKWFKMADASQQRRDIVPFSSGDVGRVALYTTLVKDIEAARTELDDDGMWFGTRSIASTEKALTLFWKMQWNDRPGLEHLCERTETEDHYINLRCKLFAAEEPEVRSHFISILRQVASALWARLEFWDFTRAWYSDNRFVIESQSNISVDELESWVRGLVAELTVEVISKIGIRRAISLDHADVCAPDTDWILERMSGRLEELLEGTAVVLKIQAPGQVFRFGSAIGLQAHDIIDEAVPLLAVL